MIIRFLLLLSVLPLALSAQQGDRPGETQASPISEEKIPPSPVLSPEEALKTIVVQPGFRVELVAAEPLIHDPVAMTFDEDGALYVVEMRGFMPNVDGRGEDEPIGQIVRLRDTNGDGQMDESVVYLDQLVLPRAVAAVHGGLLVAAPPYVWFTRDTNGDGRADEKTVIADDYAHSASNPEHAANGLMRGLDNWIHNARYDGRFRRVERDWVRAPSIQRGQWGISMDDYGRIFTNTNSRHLLADVIPDHYYTRNPTFPHRAGVYERIARNEMLWPIRVTPGTNRAYQPNYLREDGTLRNFTAACGPVIYRGHLFPPEFRNNAFVAEPAAHLVRRSIVTENEDGTLRARNAYEQEEFLASTDERFRPVNLHNGPDGALYIVDMYRGLIQHRDFLTTYLRNQALERGLDRPLGLGRIYRVVPEDHVTASFPTFSRMTPAEWVQHLAHPNGWSRDTAQRLLVENTAIFAVPDLFDLALSHPEPVARIHALWALEGIGALDPGLLTAVLAEEHPQLVATAIRLSERFLTEPDETLAEALLALADDARVVVRRQLALSLGPVGGVFDSMLARLVHAHPHQPFLVEALTSGLAGREVEFLRPLLGMEWADQGAAERVLGTIASSVIFAREAGPVDQLFIWIAEEETAPVAIRAAVLRGIESRLIRNRRGEVEKVRLEEQPPALALLMNATVPELAAAVLSLATHLSWPETSAASQPTEVSTEETALFASGRHHYQVSCAACHQEDGRGMEGLAPELAGSKWVTGPHPVTARIILHGKESDEGMMPPMGFFDDETIAAILTYIRREWGNNASVVTPEMLAEIRAETEGRQNPFPERDLQRLLDRLGR